VDEWTAERLGTDQVPYHECYQPANPLPRPPRLRGGVDDALTRRLAHLDQLIASLEAARAHRSDRTLAQAIQRWDDGTAALGRVT
jgi:hypothetical protein